MFKGELAGYAVRKSMTKQSVMHKHATANKHPDERLILHSDSTRLNAGFIQTTRAHFPTISANVYSIPGMAFSIPAQKAICAIPRSASEIH